MSESWVKQIYQAVKMEEAPFVRKESVARKIKVRGVIHC